MMKTFPKAILWGGCIAGTLDITAACIDSWINFNVPPMRLLQVVAAALLGPASLTGGIFTAILGLVMHFSVAFTFTAIFYQLSRSFPVLLKWALPAGLVYGAVIFIVMYRGTIPLTIALRSLYLDNVNHTYPKLRWQQFIIHLLCVGLPIALAARRFPPKAKSAYGLPP
ncbi:MAG: hypothetical protein JWM32_897 [Verrucomicrobia bacterium]|nr:hypothetical protein [Verrucomicrobiota bacterium]